MRVLCSAYIIIGAIYNFNVAGYKYADVSRRNIFNMFMKLLMSFFMVRAGIFRNMLKIHQILHQPILKVPKRENFSLSFFALSEPIWVCDLGTGEKNRIFSHLTPDFDGFWFFAANWVCGKQKEFEARPKLKVGGGCLWAHKHAYNVYFGKFWSFSSFMNVKEV